MIIILILGLMLGAASIVFALQNTAIVTVTFFSWELHGSLSLILLLAMGAGVLVCVLVSISEVVKTQIEFSVLKRINKKLEDDNANYKKIISDFTNSKKSLTKPAGL